MKPASKNKTKKGYKAPRRGVALVLVVVAMIILSAIGLGIMQTSFGERLESVKLKNEAVAMMAAEAGYEKAVFRMGQQMDLLSALDDPDFDTTETINFTDSSCEYSINFHEFIGARPIYRIVSTGHCGRFQRTVDVLVVQAVSGWDMGMCRVPSGPNSTYEVYFVNGEIIDIPVHINCYAEPDDSERDIHISGDPEFIQTVSMGESRYDSDEDDKYSDVMDCFDSGIYFNQPASRVTDQVTLATKVDKFRQTLEEQKPELIFSPVANNDVPNAKPSVQLEFFVKDGVGYVQITEDCTVRGYMRDGTTTTWDYKLDTEGSDQFTKYHIYGYHVIPENAESRGKRYVRSLESTEVLPSYGGVQGLPGGQIYVDGNVIIGSNQEKFDSLGADAINTVKGKITVVATGNIWLTESLEVDGDHQENGLPMMNNPNIVGLVSQGVVKVADPGRVTDICGDSTGFMTAFTDSGNGDVYEPIGEYDYSPNSHYRHLPRYTVVEAAITVGGGGWGAEDVRRGSYGGRKEASGGQNYIVVHGTISEAIRGVVGCGSDGYHKQYYLDQRMMQGILPGDIWLKGKYIPAPSGWHDYRPTE